MIVVIATQKVFYPFFYAKTSSAILTRKGASMGGFFGVVSRRDCVTDVFYGTDYHCHLGTRRGGLAMCSDGEFTRYIHDITNAQFRSKFDSDLARMRGTIGIGVISDYEDQPLIIRSHLGVYAIVTVGMVKNADKLVNEAFGGTAHFSEMSGSEVNPTELIATIISHEDSYEAGIRRVEELIEGSCSLMLLTPHGVYAARDKLGRTPVILGRKDDSYAITMETCAFPNLDYEVERELGPGEIVLINDKGFKTLVPPGSTMQICSFPWIYYGYPASSYEGINVEEWYGAERLASATRPKSITWQAFPTRALPCAGLCGRARRAVSPSIREIRP
jgi:amidophosphoribosyltransferase